MIGWRTKDQDYSPDGVVMFQRRRRLELYEGEPPAKGSSWLPGRDGRSLAESFVIEKVASRSPNGTPRWKWTKR